MGALRPCPKKCSAWKLDCKKSKKLAADTKRIIGRMKNESYVRINQTQQIAVGTLREFPPLKAEFYKFFKFSQRKCKHGEARKIEQAALNEKNKANRSGFLSLARQDSFSLWPPPKARPSLRIILFFFHAIITSINTHSASMKNTFYKACMTENSLKNNS